MGEEVRVGLGLSAAGHGFGGGLFPLTPLGGLQAWCGGRCRKPVGLFWARVLGDPAPSIPLGPARDGGTVGRQSGCGGEGGKGTVWRAQSPPKDRAPPPKREGERVMAAAVAVAWRRAACSAGTRGMHKVPECACVRGAGPPAAPLPGAGLGGRRDRRSGRGFPSARPASRAGPGARGLPRAQGGKRGLGGAPRPRPSHGRVPATGAGASRYSMTRQRGRCCEKYLKSSGVAPGQLVSSSSSSSCSCTRPDSPVVVSSGQPAAGSEGGSVRAAQGLGGERGRRGQRAAQCARPRARAGTAGPRLPPPPPRTRDCVSAPGVSLHKDWAGWAGGLSGGGWSLPASEQKRGSHLPETGGANSPGPGGASARSLAPVGSGGAT